MSRILKVLKTRAPVIQESSVREAHQHLCLSVYTVGIINQIHILSSKHQVLIMDD